MEKPGSHISNWAIPEKNQAGEGLRIWNFQGLIKNEVEFPGLIKKIV